MLDIYLQRCIMEFMRRDYSFKNHKSYVEFNGSKPKTYTDYLRESDYNKRLKEFYIKLYENRKK